MACSLWIALPLEASACSWDKPIWSKDRRSDTFRFRFVVDGKAGFIDQTGKVIISPRFTVSGNHGYDDFFEGVAAPEMLRGSHIDSNGRALNFSSYSVSGFEHYSQGLIPAGAGSVNARRYGFVDQQGKLAIAAEFESVGDFSEGLATFLLHGKWGYLDHTGEPMIPPWFTLAEEFSEGAARVIIDGPCNFVPYGPCGEFNIMVLGLGEYRSGHDARYGACRYAFIDRRGAALFPQRFPDAFDFSEGFAAVGNGRRWGFIDKAGTIRIPFIFEAVGSFFEGLAKFRQGGKWGFIDRLGRVVIPAQYEEADDFSGGAAVVGTPYERVWFIDRTGRSLFGRSYHAASGYRLGLAHVTDGSRFDYIDRTGRSVFTYHESSKSQPR